MVTAQVPVTPAGAVIFNPTSGVVTLLVKHTTTGATVFLGGPGVTVANGYPLEAHNEIELAVEEAPFHAITAAGTVTVFAMAV